MNNCWKPLNSSSQIIRSFGLVFEVRSNFSSSWANWCWASFLVSSLNSVVALTLRWWRVWLATLGCSLVILPSCDEHTSRSAQWLTNRRTDQLAVWLTFQLELLIVVKFWIFCKFDIFNERFVNSRLKWNANQTEEKYDSGLESNTYRESKNSRNQSNVLFNQIWTSIPLVLYWSSYRETKISNEWLEKCSKFSNSRALISYRLFFTSLMVGTRLSGLQTEWCKRCATLALEGCAANATDQCSITNTTILVMFGVSWTPESNGPTNAWMRDIRH